MLKIPPVVILHGMEINCKPLLVVRRVSANSIEYFIRQGKDIVNFFLDQRTHEELEQAQIAVDQAPRTLAPRIVLEIAEIPQSESAPAPCSVPQESL